MNNNIWRNIRILIKETDYSDAERYSILLRWQTNILKVLPPALNSPITNDGDISKIIFSLQQKAQTDGDIVLLDALKYLIVPGKFTCDDLNDFMHSNAINYKYILGKTSNPYGGRFLITDSVFEAVPTKYDKIFISHSHSDADLIKSIFDLIGIIGVSDEMVFCSSIPECGVPLDEDIYEVIRKQLINKKVYVIFVLSENYYNSVACLNEMGAAWILQTAYTTFLAPGFDFSDIKGGINAARIGIKLDGDETEIFSRLTEFKDKIQLGFGLKRIDERKWNRKVHEFLETVSSSYH